MDSAAASPPGSSLSLKASWVIYYYLLEAVPAVDVDLKHPKLPTELGKWLLGELSRAFADGQDNTQFKY